MVSITSWTRLEPRCRDAQLADGLQATVHDPLWLLTRQWQLGEFAAHDGGTAVMARIRVGCAPLSRYRPGPVDSDADAHRYDARRQPLETVVEGESPDEAAEASGAAVDMRAAAEAGQHFARLLRHAGVGGYVEAFRRHRPIAPDEPAGGATRDGDLARFLAVVAGRTIHGAALYADLQGLARTPDGTLAELPDAVPVDEDDRDAVATAAGRWVAWYEHRHRTAAGPTSAWSPERMTHRFAVSALTDDDEAVLSVPRYDGGHLDWDSFDHAPGATLRGDRADGGAQPHEIVSTVLPARVRYRGMPADHWWELEDARADFGAMDTSPEDLLRLLFVEYVISYGNDWRLVPVEVDVGSLCRIRSLIVTDTFGRRTLIRHHADVDGDDRAWRMFCLSGAGGAATGDAGRMLLVPPVLPGGQHGPAVEEVILRRDGTANLAWAIERTVPGPLGEPVDRTRPRRAVSDRTGDRPEPQAPFLYRLTTPVPDHWFPLVPVRTGEPPTVRLVRGRMLSLDEDTDGPRPHGALLTPDSRLALFDEDLPRAGVRLVRRDECARWSDGSTHLWRTRRRFTGGGEAWSGLRYDVVEPADG